MNINKQKLKQIILQELAIIENEDQLSKLKTKAMSTSQRQQVVRDRIKGQGQEFTTNEQGLVDQFEYKGRSHEDGGIVEGNVMPVFREIIEDSIDQLEEFISNLASEPGVDLVQHRPLLQRILKLLKKQIQGEPANNKDQK